MATITLGKPVGIADVVAIARGGARVAIGSSAISSSLELA